MLFIREFVEEDYYKFARKEFDLSRQHLNSCGKPKDWYDVFLIKLHKDTVSIFKKYVDKDK